MTDRLYLAAKHQHINFILFIYVYQGNIIIYICENSYLLRVFTLRRQFNVQYTCCVIKYIQYWFLAYYPTLFNVTRSIKNLPFVFQYVFSTIFTARHYTITAPYSAFCVYAFMLMMMKWPTLTGAINSLNCFGFFIIND